MRILFDQASQDMRNKGNNALLQSAMERLSSYWPDASLEVITNAPNLLKMYFPYAYPVSPHGLYTIRNRFDNYIALMPKSIGWFLFELREEIWHRREMQKHTQVPQAFGKKTISPVVEDNNIEASTINYGTNSLINAPDQKVLVETISKYDLYVASGGGYMCDTDWPMLRNVFNRLEVAINCKIPTVMVGQGIGPIKDPRVLARASQILPAVDLILYRNQRYGLPLLLGLGVFPEHIIFTGDDAVEMTYKAHQKSCGSGIGVSLRVAQYTQVREKHIDIIRTVLHRAAEAYKVQLISVPISSARHESDITYIKKILTGYSRSSIGYRKLDTPLDSIKRVRRCRLMVTGTYHGAIFALAQGIPVVGVANSDEYFNKLSELADEFGSGCQVFQLEDEQLSDKLRRAIDNAWSSAEIIKPVLLESTVRQINLQKAAYQRIYELSSGRMGTRKDRTNYATR